MNFKDYSRLFVQAGERLGFEDSAPDETGFCSFDFGGTFLTCSTTNDFSMIRVTAPVAEIPGECPRAILERLLEAQIFFKDTRGATFSYSHENGLVLLHLNLPTDVLDPVKLETALKNCAEVSVHFSQELMNILQGTDTKPETDDVVSTEEAFSSNMISV